MILKVTFFLLLFYFTVESQSLTGETDVAVSVDPSQLLCDAADSATVCNAKKLECSPINEIVPVGMTMSALRTCTKESGVTLGPELYKNIGQVYTSKTPEILLENAAPNFTLAVKQCALQKLGLIDADLKFNRTAVIEKLSKQPLKPHLIVPVFDALATCPEPVNFTISPFLNCVRRVCIQNSATILVPWTAYIPDGASQGYQNAGFGQQYDAAASPLTYIPQNAVPSSVLEILRNFVPN